MSIDGFIKEPVQASYTVHFSPDKPDRFILRVNNPQQKKIKVRIHHIMKGVIVDTVISNESYACRYNFANAEEGRYVVQVKCGKEKYKRIIDVSSEVNVKRGVDVH